MRKLIVFLLFGCSVMGYSQTRLEGSKIAGLQGGITGSGIYAGGWFDYAMKQKLDIGLFGGIDKAEIDGLKLSSTFFDAYAKYYVVASSGIRVYGKGGITFSSDKTVDSEVLDESTSKFGFHYGGGIDYYLGSIVVGAQANQRIFTNEQFGKNRYSIGLNVGFLF